MALLLLEASIIDLHIESYLTQPCHYPCLSFMFGVKTNDLQSSWDDATTKEAWEAILPRFNYARFHQSMPRRKWVTIILGLGGS